MPIWLSRMRASNAGYVPTDLHVEYYAQRASAGLIIGEGTEISPDAYGWADSPGLWSTEQVQGWGRVTDAVHQNGSFMYIELWHTGAMSHPDFFAGALPMSASAVNPEQVSVTPSGRKPTVTPRPMTKAENSPDGSRFWHRGEECSGSRIRRRADPGELPLSDRSVSE